MLRLVENCVRDLVVVVKVICEILIFINVLRKMKYSGVMFVRIVIVL